MDDFLEQPLQKIALKSAWDMKNYADKGPESVLTNGKGSCRGIEYLVNGGEYLSSQKGGETLSSGLTQIKNWIDKNADNMQPLFLNLNFRDITGTPGEYVINPGSIEELRFGIFNKLNGYVNQYIGNGNIYKPKDLMTWFGKKDPENGFSSATENISEGMMRHGLPTLQEIGPKVLIYVSGENILKYSYAQKFDLESDHFFYDYEVVSYKKKSFNRLPDKNAIIYSFNTNYDRGEGCKNKKSLMDSNLTLLKNSNALIRIYTPDPTNNNGVNPSHEEKQLWDYARDQIKCNILTTTFTTSSKFFADEKDPYKILA